MIWKALSGDCEIVTHYDRYSSPRDTGDESLKSHYSWFFLVGECCIFNLGNSSEFVGGLVCACDLMELRKVFA